MSFVTNPDIMYRLLIQSVADYAIYMLTPQGVVANWNPGAERAKGYRADEIIGQHYSLFYCLSERNDDVPARNLEQARCTGRFEEEGWRVRKNGTAFRAHVVIEAVHDDDGALVGFAKVTRDISERHRQEQELVKAKELAEQYSQEMSSLSRFLDSVIAHIPASVIVQDVASQRILLANPNAERLFGATQGCLRGRLPSECCVPGVAAYLQQQLERGAHSTTGHVAETRVQTAIGPRTLRSRALLAHNPEGQGDYVLYVAEDATEALAAHAQIHHMAHHDALTGLPNRTLFHERLRHALEDGSVHGRLTATLCLDLDHFKSINDSLGHAFGDKLLRALARRLRRELREQDTLARLGGDEFAVVLGSLDCHGTALLTAQRLIDAVRPPFQIEGHTFSVGLSIGLAFAPQDHTQGEQLLGYADMALYHAKRSGRDRYECFDVELDVAARQRRLVETDLRTALHLGQLRLHYQAVVDRQLNEISGYEALLRWEHPTRGMVMPLDFIPIAEETGLIHELGARALNLACQEAASWGTQQTVAVNLSPVQFRNANLVHTVALALGDAGLPAHRLELEITESVLLSNSEDNLRTLRALKDLGVSISLDDFGTGYSSLGYLRAFPFDRIKIDKSFVHDMLSSREALSIVQAITGLSSSLMIKTTAEGVESQEQRERLAAEGCSHFQGYLYGRPVPPSQRLRTLDYPNAC